MATLLTDWFLRPGVFRLVQDVPDHVAACEFECRKIQCQQEDWATCADRLRAPWAATDILAPQ